jgi:hypothetical protein
MKGKKRPRPVEMTHEAVCPFCGALLAFAHEPAGIVHGMPLCEEMRARVLMLEAGGARGKA